MFLQMDLIIMIIIVLALLHCTMNNELWNISPFFPKYFIHCVTNITLLGLAMVNWSIGLLNPGGDNSYHGIRSCTGSYQ